MEKREIPSWVTEYNRNQTAKEVVKLVSEDVKKILQAKKAMDIEALSRENEPPAFIEREKYDKVCEALKELLTILDYYHNREVLPYKNWTAIISKATELLKKEKQ